MYPIVRLLWQFHKHRNDAPLAITGEHVSEHLCLPWDLDIFWELNNGRTLTLYDLGRLPLGRRTGMFKALRANGWGMTVAGSSTRYRRRIRAFNKIRMRSRGIGWDHRFIYTEQSMWRTDGECAGHVLIRSAVTGPGGIVPPAKLLAAMGYDGPQITPPDWVTAWSDADAQRPWPPMQDA